jgi:hypothetical protein
MVLFCVVDDHIHVILLCDRKEAGRMAQRILLALRPLTAVSLDPARIRPVETRAHLQWLVRYILNQPRHHQLEVHPALFEGSCFLDLIGARVLEGLTLRIRQALPRFHLDDSYDAVRARPVELSLVTGEKLRRAGAARLAAAGAAALGVERELTGTTRPVVSARVAVSRIARSVGIPISEIAYALGITPQAARRLARRVIDDRFLKSVALRIALEDSIGEQIEKAVFTVQAPSLQ